MLYLKGCPRCRGDLYLDRDAHGPFRQCFQCGWIQDLRDIPSLVGAGVPVKASPTSTPGRFRKAIA